MADITSPSGDTPQTEGAAATSAPPTSPPRSSYLGGSSGSNNVIETLTRRPEGKLPEALEQEYVGRGQASTGHTYGGYARRFLTWLGEQGMWFDSMPPGTVDRFLAETQLNPVTRNLAGTAMRAMLAAAEKMELKFHPQTVTRVKSERKKAAARALAASQAAARVAPAPGLIAGHSSPFAQQLPPPPQHASPTMTQPTTPPPSPAVPSSTHQQVVHMADAPLPPPVVAVHKPVATPQNQGAFPSLGTRVRILRMSTPNDGMGIPAGTLIPIGVYNKSNIESDGTIENFLMWRVRPHHGPQPGQAPVLYRVQNLDMSSKPMPGQEWEFAIAADIGTTTGMAQAAGAPYNMQPMQQMQQQPQVMAPAAQQSVTPGAVMERLLDTAFKAQETAQAKYEALANSLMQKKNEGQVDQTMMMLLLDRAKPAPIDMQAIMRQFREELERHQTPAPAVPTPPLGNFFEQKEHTPSRMDVAMEQMTQLMRAQQEFNNQLMMKLMTQPPPPPPPPQKDPLEMLSQVLSIVNRPDPVREEMNKALVQQMLNPPKSKGLAEALADLQAVQRFANPPQDPPSMAETLSEVLTTALENSDKLGDMFVKLRSGTLATTPVAVAGAAQRQLTAARAAAPAAQGVQGQPAAAAAPVAARPGTPSGLPPAQGTRAPPEVVEAMLAMVNTPEGAEEVLVQNLWNLTGVLQRQPDPRWPQVAAKVMELYLAASNRLEVQNAVIQLFRWVGASRILGEHPQYVERLTTVLHQHYTTIVKMMANLDKTLPDSNIYEQQAAAPEAELAEQDEASDEDCEEPEEGEDGEDEETSDEDEDWDDESSQVAYVAKAEPAPQQTFQAPPAAAPVAPTKAVRRR